jgi:hypothetical protein
VTLVLVTKEALAELLEESYSLTEALAVEGGALRPSQGERIELLPSEPMVTLAVEAGVQIPGPMLSGTVPPAPPEHQTSVRVTEVPADSDGVQHAPTFRKLNDQRLRCTEDGKVVYTSMEQAEHAAKRISEREPMTCYRGRCGHYHVSRKKGSRR